MKRIYTLFALIVLCAVFLTVTDYLKGQAESKNTVTPKETTYILIAENDTVKLYYGDILMKTYDGIETDVLPPTDRDNLKSGIILKSYDEVQSIIEDFDG